MALRTDRIAHQLREEIARVLREEATDPRIGSVTLTKVDVAPDLSNAIVLWSIFEAKGANDVKDQSPDIEAIQAGLESAAGFIRRSLAHSLALRRMPALRFRHDPSLKIGSDTLELLQAIRNGEEKK